MEKVVMSLCGAQTGTARQAWDVTEGGSFVLTFGLFAHGNQYGLTRATVDYPILCSFINKCVEQWFPSGTHSWTSVSILVNCKSKLHKDSHNLTKSMNLTCSVGSFQHGQLWLEAVEGDPQPLGPMSWRELPNGTRAPGYLVDTYKKPFAFEPKRYHGASNWTGHRGSVNAYAARSVAAIDPDLRRQLRRAGFVLPTKAQIQMLETPSMAVETEDLDHSTEERLTAEDQLAIMSPLKEANAALDEIFNVYPAIPVVQLAQVCQPWMEPDTLAAELLDFGISWSSNFGFGAMFHATTKAKRYLKVLRHLLLLSRDQLQAGGQVAWIIPPESQALSVSEVRRFWSQYGHGKSALDVGPCKLATTSSKLLNSIDPANQAPLYIWKRMCQSISTASEVEIPFKDAEEAVMAIDITPLNTLTSQELDKLMQVAHQLHRKFGHPSNRLLIKNLQARNADPKVIAAVSLLKCDECQEGKIKLPAPAVNLERTDKLWSCLQVDGFTMRLSNQVHHFVLMVDEASGYAVIREAFRHSEEEHQNLSGGQMVEILREAWFAYFGYPEQLKMDLEGAHRSTVLSEECLTHGIEIVAAPAEHHQAIAEVERTIGHVRHKVEVFLREQNVDPKVAALTMVMTHNSLARVHGFSPLQWTMGRDWSPGLRLLDLPRDDSFSANANRFGATMEVRRAAEKAFLDHRAHDIASRAKNAKTRGSVQFLPGDLIYFRRQPHPADLPANNVVDRPRLRTGRWYGPGRILASETKVDGQSRRPSLIIWAIAGGRLKRFHASQLRHAPEAERLVAEATSAISMPWTMTSLSKLMAKGTYDDETRPRRKHWPRTPTSKRRSRREAHHEAPREGASAAVREPPADPEDSEAEMIPDREMRKRTAPGPAEASGMGGQGDLDLDRLLEDVTYLPQEFDPSFRQRRQAHEYDERPWHVRDQGSLQYVSEAEVDGGIFSTIVEIPEDERAWKRILK
ncbi:unnamed protein product [Symbiodinium sp. CCMP2592]|nr:unnamed protein product [Symbiodinium sp. CCMP2592]